MTATVEQLEQAAAATWTPDDNAVVDGWRLSSNGGFTRRLNSATAVGMAKTSLEAKRAVSRWLSERGSSLVVRVTPLTDPDTAESCERNWYLEQRDETIVMSRRISDRERVDGVAVVDPSDETFVDEFFTLNGRRSSESDTWDQMVSRGAPDVAGLWVKGAAVGFVAVSGSLAFVYSVAVEDTRRRQGLATRVMAAAEQWAVGQGARSMTVQVLGTNGPARGLYGCLGYSEAYRYHYLEPLTH